jgi:hypothetical protein
MILTEGALDGVEKMKINNR